jgi:hypothetical protein
MRYWPMPILPMEPSVFPEDLLTAPGIGEETSGWWRVFHTLPRAEKCLAPRTLEASPLAPGR